MVKPLLSDSERSRIEATIADVEGRTSLELVVAVVARSADYWHWRVLLALCSGLSGGLAVLEWAPHVAPHWALLLQLPVGALAFLALGQGALHRWLVPARTSAAAVQGHAFRLFAERGLHHTRDHTGLLILVSLLERRVTLLGDSALHARVGEGGWQRHVEHLVGRLREGQATTGIVEVIQRIEATLGHDFPIGEHDVNELPNAVIEQH
ncbi:MAG: TPM domain-containing protein [Polyangiaceae bacterium]